ncbi:MAG: hypothetical protein NT141_00510 [candidate division WWE3 bacterium]|nr:hypothetical protein [candidate division WWE3 bacterium]
MRKRLLSISISVAVIFVIGALIYSNWGKLSNVKNLVNEVSYKLHFPIVAIIDGNPLNTHKSNILYRSDVDVYFTKEWQYLSTQGGESVDQKYSSYEDVVNTLVKERIIHNELVTEKLVPSEADVEIYITRNSNFNKADALAAIQNYGWNWQDYLFRQRAELEEKILRNQRDNFANVSYLQIWHEVPTNDYTLYAEKLASESATKLKSGLSFGAVFASISAEAQNSDFNKTKPFSISIASISGQLLSSANNNMTPYMSDFLSTIGKNPKNKVGKFIYSPYTDLITIYLVNQANLAGSEGFDSWLERLNKQSLVLGFRNSVTSAFANSGFFNPTFHIVDPSGGAISGSYLNMDAISDNFSEQSQGHACPKYDPTYDVSCNIGSGSSCTISGGVDCTNGYWTPGVCIVDKDSGCSPNCSTGSNFVSFKFGLYASNSYFKVTATGIEYDFQNIINGDQCQYTYGHWICDSANGSSADIYLVYKARTVSPPPSGTTYCSTDTNTPTCSTGNSGAQCTNPADCYSCNGTSCDNGRPSNKNSCTSTPNSCLAACVPGSNPTATYTSTTAHINWTPGSGGAVWYAIYAKPASSGSCPSAGGNWSNSCIFDSVTGDSSNPVNGTTACVLGVTVNGYTLTETTHQDLTGLTANTKYCVKLKTIGNSCTPDYVINFTTPATPPTCTVDSTAAWVTPLNGTIAAVTVPVSYTESASVTWSPSVIIGNAPVSYWKLDEASGQSATDSIGPNTATGVSTTIVSGISGKARSFNGTSAYIKAPIGTHFGYNNPLTVQAWVNITATTNGPVFGITDSPPGGGWNVPFISVNSTNIYGWIWGVNNNMPISAVTSTGWHLLTMTYTPTGGGREILYIDGRAAASGTGSYTANNSTVYWTNYISGSKPDGVNSYFNGVIDEVKIYNYTRTPAEVLTEVLASTTIGTCPVGKTCGLTISSFWPAVYGPTTLSMATSPVSAPICTPKPICVVQKPGSPTSPVTSIITDTSATITWIAPAVGSKSCTFDSTACNRCSYDYNIAYGLTSDPTTALDYNSWQVSGPIGVEPTLSYTINGLSCNTTYHYRIKRGSGYPNVESDWTGDATFTTAACSVTCTGPTPSTTDWVTPANGLVNVKTAAVSYSTGAITTFSPSITPALATVGTCPSSFTGNTPVAYWKMDEAGGSTVYNSSGSSYTGTATGTTVTTGVNGNARSLNGGTDIITVPVSDANLDLGSNTNSLTVEAWINPTNLLVTNNVYVVHTGWYILGMKTDGVGDVRFYDNNTGSGAYTTTALTTGSWHHVVGVKNGTSFAIYFDGVLQPIVLQGTWSSSGNLNQTIYIGGSSAAHMIGGIDEVKIYNYARNQAQILEDMGSCNLTVSAADSVNYGPATLSMTTNPFSSPLCTNKPICVVQKPATPTSLTATSITSNSETLGWSSFSTGAIPSAYWKLDEALASAPVIDSSGSGNTGKATGTTVVSGVSGNARSFNGSSDYIDLGSNFAGITNKFTISFWVNPATSQVTYADIFGNHGGTTPVGMVFQQNDTTTNQYSFAYGNGYNYVGSNVVNLAANTWQHVAITKDSTNCIIYINGVAGTPAPCTSLVSPQTTYPANLRLGTGFVGGLRPFNGKIDDFKIYYYVRTPAQILDDKNLVVTAPTGCTWDANTCSACQYNYYAEWGLSSGNYTAGNSGWLNNPPAAWNNEITSTSISGLTCNTPYYWRVRRGTGYNNAGNGVESLSTESTFTTSACPYPTGQIYFNGSTDDTKRMHVVNPPSSGSLNVGFTGNVESTAVNNANIDFALNPTSTSWTNLSTASCGGGVSICPITSVSPTGGFNIPYNFTNYGNYLFRISGGSPTQTCVGDPWCSSFYAMTSGTTYSSLGAYACPAYYDCGSMYNTFITDQDYLTLVVCKDKEAGLGGPVTSLSTSAGSVAHDGIVDTIITSDKSSIKLNSTIPWPSSYLACMDGTVKLQVSTTNTFSSIAFSSDYVYKQDVDSNYHLYNKVSDNIVGDTSSYSFPLTDFAVPTDIISGQIYYWRAIRYMNTNDADASTGSASDIRAFVIPPMSTITLTVKDWDTRSTCTGGTPNILQDGSTVSVIDTPAGGLLPSFSVTQIIYNGAPNYTYTFLIPTGDSYHVRVAKTGYSSCDGNYTAAGSANINLNISQSIPGWIQAVDGDVYIKGLTSSNPFPNFNNYLMTGTLPNIPGILGSRLTATPSFLPGYISTGSPKYVGEVSISCDQLNTVISKCSGGCAVGSYTVTSNPSYTTVGSVKTANSSTTVVLSSFSDLQQYTYVIPSGSFLVCGDINVTNYSNTTKSTTPGITAKLDPGIFVVPSKTLSSSGVGTSHVSWKEISQ